MAILETPRFEIRPSYGFRSIPRYSTTKILMKSGDEIRNRNWSYPIHEFQISIDSRHQDDIYGVREFFHAVGGDSYGFRLKDLTDYKTCRPSDAASALDAPLVAIGDGSYQLFKQYEKGARTQSRKILKPVGSTVVVANEEGEVQASNLWVLDATTGILTPEEGFDGTPTTWGGEFDVPVRFDGDALNVEAVEFETESVSFTLVELREP